ncbi:hypothetical protein B0H14DRAFT_2592626 [Mycena olivaceomarginata]|nr:hypothetical protein B0H14DRAFT_2592626 [Mycena olivaceomarginata]
MRKSNKLTHRNSNSARRESPSLQGESFSVEKVHPDSQISFSQNRSDVHAVMDAAKGGTMFTALPVELRVEVFLQFCGSYCRIGQFAEGPIMPLSSDVLRRTIGGLRHCFDAIITVDGIVVIVRNVGE